LLFNDFSIFCFLLSDTAWLNFISKTETNRCTAKRRGRNEKAAAVRPNHYFGSSETQGDETMTVYLSPYRRLATLRQAMDRMLEENMAETAPAEREMTLALDVTAQEEGYTLRALVPGIEADDLAIEILNNTVSIRGEFVSARRLAAPDQQHVDALYLWR
jgi:hypothetical protein